MFGELVVIDAAGRISISPDRMREIGVEDGSKCWGVWQTDHSGRKRSSSEEPKPDQLIISPIPPFLWPRLIRVELRLKNRRAALYEAATVLSDAKLNILFAEAAPSGHNHATWNVITAARLDGNSRGDSQSVKNAIDAVQVAINKTEKDQAQFNPAHPEARKLGHDLALAMFDECIAIQILLEEQGKKKDFLHQEIEDYSLYKLDGIDLALLQKV